MLNILCIYCPGIPRFLQARARTILIWLVVCRDDVCHIELEVATKDMQLDD